MSQFRTAFWRLFLLIAASGLLHAQDRIFIYPAGNSPLVTIVDAATLAVEASIPAPNSAFQVVRNLDGSKYYLISRTSADSVTVVDAASLSVLKTISLGASASAAELTPDGKYLLVAAGRLHIFDAETDEPVREAIPVGGAPTRLLVNNTATLAYVLAGGGDVIQVIDLESLEIQVTIDAPNASGIALARSDSRLLAVHPGGIAQYRTIDHQLINNLEPLFPLLTAGLIPLEGGQKVFVQTGGIAPNNTSQVFELDTGEVRPVGAVGTTELSEVAPIDATRAYGVLADGGQLVEIDLTAANPTVTPLGIGGAARSLDLAPNRKVLFVSSLIDATLVTVDTATNTEISSVILPLAAANHQAVFQPSMLPPANLTLVGGSEQFVPPGALLPIPIAVRVSDAEGAPLQGVPVLFTDPANRGTVITPEQPSLTNIRGVASIRVTAPMLEEEPPAAEPAGEPKAQAVSASSESSDEGGEGGEGEEGAEAPASAAAADSGAVAQGEEEPVLDPITLVANSSGLAPVAIVYSLILQQGLLTVSGNNQLTAPNEPFPEEFVLLATDKEGNPLPAGTAVTLAPFLARCPQNELPVDPNGFVRFTCVGGVIPQGAGTFLPGSIAAEVAAFQQELGLDLSRAAFQFNIASGANTVGLEIISGNNQSERTGAMLPQPLRWRLTTGFGATGRIGVRARQVAGPPVFFAPRSFSVFPGITQSINVTLGDNAGTVVVELTASAPGLPSIQFTIEAMGGQPERLEISGNNQSARIATQAANPLRVQVFDESGGLVPFPEVNWTVVEGEATLQVSTDTGGSSAIVMIGNTPGPIRIQASIATLVAEFTLTATPPEPASISTVSGQSQIISTGMLSEPLLVQVNEVSNLPSPGTVVTFSGPPNVRLHPAGEGEPSNPVQVTTDANGRAGVRVELLPAGQTALRAAGATKEQLTTSVVITAMVGQDLSTSFMLNVVGRTPAFQASGVVNAATFEAGIVPGSLASLFGQGLSEGIVGTALVGGATSFRGTTLRIGGAAAPLLSITAGEQEQINFQVPLNLTPGQNVTIEVENNGSRSTVGGVPVLASQPGIFEIPIGGGATVGAVLHGNDFSLVTPDNPAAHGEVVAMFFTGGGPLNPPVPAGTLGPSPPSVMTLPVVVGVDAKGAAVLFQGYAPGFLGLYQANFVIPEDARCGIRPLNVKVGENTSPLSTIAIRCP